MNNYPSTANHRRPARRLTALAAAGVLLAGGCTKAPDVQPSPSPSGALACDHRAEALGQRTLTDIIFSIGGDDKAIPLDTFLGKNGKDKADKAWGDVKSYVSKETVGPIPGITDPGAWVVNADVAYAKGRIRLTH